MKTFFVLGFAIFVSACSDGIEVPAADAFSLPPVLAPSSVGSMETSGGESKTFDLVLQHGQTAFLPDSPADTMGINGDFLGPMVVVHRGDEVTLNVKNNIGETSTIHWHGLHIPPDMDGGPHQQIEAGTTWSPEFTIDNRAGLYWFHPHLEGITGRHVYSGLAGLMIIQDEEEAALDLPRDYGVDDFPLVIQDRRIDNDGQLLYMNMVVDHAGMRGKNILVNGRKTPPLAVPAQRIRLRILNGSNARFYQLGFSDERAFDVIASDGGLLAAPVQRTRLEMGTGERYEVVVDLSDAEGETIQLMSYSSELGLNSMDFDEIDRSDFVIMMLVVGAPNDAPAGPVPSILSILPDSSEPSTDNMRVFRFDMNVGGVMTINGKTMEMDRIDETVFLGDTEVWTLMNMSDVPHPVHIHDVQFRVLSRRGSEPEAYEKGWKDTVILHPREPVRVRLTFEDFADPEIPYMYHCHILEHEDRGMMGQFLVKER